MLSTRIIHFFNTLFFWLLLCSSCKATNPSYINIAHNSYRFSVESIDDHPKRSFSLEPVLIEYKQPHQQSILHDPLNSNSLHHNQSHDYVSSHFSLSESAFTNANHNNFNNNINLYLNNNITLQQGPSSVISNIWDSGNSLGYPAVPVLDNHFLNRCSSHLSFCPSYSCLEDTQPLTNGNISIIPYNIGNTNPKKCNDIVLKNQLHLVDHQSLLTLCNIDENTKKKKLEIVKQNRSIIKKKKKSKNEKKFPCQYCAKLFTRKDNRNKHQKDIHINPKPFQCSKCGKKLSNKRCLSEHMNLHNENLHQCSYCDKKYASLHGLREHERTHLFERPFGCNICHKRFKYSSNLRDHQKIHNNPQKYFCSFCKGVFGYQKTLKQHIKEVHLNERPFKCNHCFKQFKRKGHLKAHQKIHM